MNKTEKIILLGLGLAVLVLAAVLVFSPSPAPQTVVGEFTPPPFDAMAVEGTPPVEFPQIYGTLSLNEAASVSLYSAPTVQDGKITVCFYSKAENTAWVRLRITDENGRLLGQTGLLKPGEYVEHILLENAPRSSRAVARILTYQPETYYSLGSASANIQLQIP